MVPTYEVIYKLASHEVGLPVARFGLNIFDIIWFVRISKKASNEKT